MKFTLPIPPLSTNHGYHTNQGRWYKDQKLVDWEAECLYLLKKYKSDIYDDEAFIVKITFFFGNKRRNDIDGRIKPVLDILTKAKIYKDDSFVNDLIIKKRFNKENPRTEIEVF